MLDETSNQNSVLSNETKMLKLELENMRSKVAEIDSLEEENKRLKMENRNLEAKLSDMLSSNFLGSAGK